MLPFAPVKIALWLAFAAATTFSFVTAFSVPSLILLATIAAALVYWLFSHLDELRTAYASAEPKSATSGPYKKQIWSVKPRLKDVGPGVALLGLVPYYFAYRASQGEPVASIALAFEPFGTLGPVAFWVLFGTLMLAKGVESLLGSRIKNGDQ